jgi:protoheme IX farnesyltransferase
MRRTGLGAAGNYLEVLKPRESVLLSFIGICAAVIAGGGFTSPGRLLLVSGGLLAGSSGTNGLTNYLDRDIDAKMQRTSHRALPSGRIYPAKKVLPLVTILVLGALVLAWWMHPFCFWAGLVGVIAALA